MTGAIGQVCEPGESACETACEEACEKAFETVRDIAKSVWSQWTVE